MAEDDDFTRITLRIPNSLHARLNEATAKKRSMNAEIIARLEDSFVSGQRFAAGVGSVTEILASVIQRVADDMRREGKSPEEFSAWMRSFPDFAPHMPPPETETPRSK
ncbi:MAG: Arc family DNA-binding protein [Methylorubrum populi]